MSDGEMLGRIQQRLKDLGLSAREASLSSGRGPDLIRNMTRAIRNGQPYSPRADTLHLLAEALGTTPQWLMTGDHGHQHPDRGPWDKVSKEEVQDAASMRVVPAAYGGRVEAGAFRSISSKENMRGQPPIHVVQDFEFPHAKMMYFNMVGDSMSELRPRPILDGDVLIGIDMESFSLFDYGARDGSIWVVDNYDYDSPLLERSVRQLELYEKGTVFHTRSAKEAFAPLANDVSKPRQQLEIVALIRYSINWLDRDKNRT